LEHRKRLAIWVAREIRPHEGRVRAWLAKAQVMPDDADECIQEAYCRLAMLEEVEHIESPYAYFFSTVKHLLLRRIKRQRIVTLDNIIEIEALQDSRPSPEQLTGGKIALEKMLAMMAELPERCRQMLELRQLDGWSYRQIAEHMGTTEKAVEKQLAVGLKEIRAAWKRGERQAAEKLMQVRLERQERS
jgi:RNA polymerase sigma-70 factor (ECF subfamily)